MPRRSFFLVPALALGTMFAASNFPDPPAGSEAAPHGKQTAIFAGGCFWGVEAVFAQLKGVRSATSGFAVGDAPAGTGNAESVKVVYDPAQISYGQLLKIFFSVAHDPTEKDRQGPDIGTEYRSVIFYTTPDQKSEAEAYIKVLNDAKAFKSPIVTEIAPLKHFSQAEEQHQHFVDRNPTSPYVVANDLPKLQQLKAQYPDLLKSK